jgi:type I restriction enzyme S subunit
MPVPRVAELEEEINQKILKVHRLREEAQELLLKVKEMIYSELGLPKIDDNGVEYFGGEVGKLVRVFEVKASDLDYRLDASYHVPILRLIKNNLKSGEEKGHYRLTHLGDGIAKIFDLPTYKRIYVRPEEGYSVLSGVHLREIKLYDLKYISGRSFFKNEESFLDKYKIKKGWILTTERGTTGLSALVTEYWDGWLASHNILRVIPQDIDSGFLLAYLNTEYAQHQLKSKELGAVVEVLDPRDMGNILIPIPEEGIQEKIGSLVIEGYDKKDKANQIEDEAIKLLEKRLKEIAEGDQDKRGI